MTGNILTKDLEYLLIFSLVLIFPKILQRFKIPSGITALAIGIGLSIFSPTIKSDPLFRFLSQIGITSLFVFAGLEVSFKELKKDKIYLTKYLLKFIIILGIISFGIHKIFSLDIQSSVLLSLGIFTPSAGFILTSLHAYDINKTQEYWVKSKAISKEVISILLLFLALQGNDIKSLAISLVFYIGLYFFLPMLFKFFFKFVSPHAPNSEIPFLVALSLISGVISKELGAYYLVGAFAVGIVGSRFRRQIFKEGEHALFRSLAGFFSVFLPFYFFYAGLGLAVGGFSTTAILIGVVMFLLFVPLRIFMINISFKKFIKDLKVDTRNISLSLMPTLIFGLVISNILLERDDIDKTIIYGLICYTILTSILPAIFFYFSKDKENEIDVI